MFFGWGLRPGRTGPLSTDYFGAAYRGPSLSLDFAADAYSEGEIRLRPADKTFADIITHTRASTGTYFDSAGVLQTAGVDVPRLDYDPLTLLPRGLLVEEQRTNLLIRSSEFDNAVWNILNLTRVSNVAVPPDGTMTADRFEQTGASGGVYQSAVVVPAADYTATWWVNLETMLASSYKFALYNNTAGAFIAVDIAPEQALFAGKWVRIKHTFTAPAGCTSVRVYPYRSSAVVTGTVLLWGAQLEAGDKPSSYIPTTTAQVTRATDVQSVNVLSPWYNVDAGNWQVRAQGNVGQPLLTAGTAVITADDAGVKDYELAYTTDQSATSVSIGTGHIESIKYYPRAVV